MRTFGMRTFGFGQRHAASLAVGVSLAAIAKAGLANGAGINFMWDAGHVEIVDSVGSLSFSGPIQDKVTFTGTKKMVVGPNGLLRWTAHNLETDSDDLTQWTTFNTTHTAGEITASGTGNHGARGTIVNVNAPVGFRVKFKRGAGDSDFGWIGSNDFGSNQASYFDVVNGTVENEAADHMASISAETDEDGYWLCEVILNNIGDGLGEFRIGVSSDGSTNAHTAGDKILAKNMHVFHYPADRTFVATSGAAAYGLATEYDINTLDGSTTENSVASSGKITLVLTGSTDYRTATTAHDDNGASYAYRALVNVNGMSFRARVAHTSSPANAPNADGTDNATWRRDDLNVRVSATDNVDGAWMLGRVKSQSSTTLTLEILKSVGSGSYDDWHVIAVKSVADEPVATNLLQYSNDFTNAAWSKSNVTITANQASSPDGTINADQMQMVTPGAGYIHQDVAVTSGAAATATLFVEASVDGYVRLFVANSVLTSSFGGWFNTSTGQWATTSTSGTGSLSVATQVLQPNGYWRIVLTGVISGETSYRMYWYLTAADNTSTRSDIPVINQYGAMLEQGSIPTSYIPTAGAAVERAADSYSIAASAFPWSNTQGWSLQELYFSYADTDNDVEVMFWHAIGVSVADFQRNNMSTSAGRTGQDSYTVKAGAGSYAGAGGSTTKFSPGIDIFKRTCTSFDATTVRMANSEDEHTGNAASVLPTIETIYIGQSSGNSGQLNGGLCSTIFGTDSSLTEAEARAMAA